METKTKPSEEDPPDRPSGVTILPVHQDDLPRLAAIYMQAYRGMEEYAEPDEEKAYHYLHWLYSSWSEGFFKALVHGAIAGFLACNPSWRNRGERILEIHEVAVDPCWKGYGIGSKLMARALEYGRSLGRSRVGLWVGEANDVAYAWYLGRGFAEQERKGRWIKLTAPLRASSSE